MNANKNAVTLAPALVFACALGACDAESDPVDRQSDATKVLVAEGMDPEGAQDAADLLVEAGLDDPELLSSESTDEERAQFADDIVAALEDREDLGFRSTIVNTNLVTGVGLSDSYKCSDTVASFYTGLLVAMSRARMDANSKCHGTLTAFWLSETHWEIFDFSFNELRCKTKFRATYGCY